MRMCSIDPGKSGAICIIENDLILCLKVMPLTIDNEIDFGEVAKLLEFYHPKKVYIEKVGSRPGQGVISMFNFGFGTGGLHAICACLNLPVVKVSPQTWQKGLMGHTKGVKHTKEMTIDFCKTLYPDVNLLASSRCKVPHDGMSDALAIAVYGLRKEAENK